MRVAFVIMVAATAVIAAGCGAVAHMSATSGNATAGKPIFVSTCGSCHTLADAATTGTIGPDLDAAFGPDQCQKVGKISTIRDIVRGQIAYAETTTSSGTLGMPDNLLTGQKARDVAAYVASVAGVPGTSSSHSLADYWDCDSGVEVSG